MEALATTLLNKALLTLLVLSILNVVRHVYLVIQAYNMNDVTNTVRYQLNNKQLILLGLSIGYIVTSIISGVYLN